MAKAFGITLFLMALAACGVDGPPVPPGEDNPRTIQSLDDLDQSAYF